MKSKKTKKKILLVDDEQIILEMYGQQLEIAGYRVLKVNDAEEAFEIVKKEKPDIILADIIMPGRNGFWLLKQVKSDKDKDISTTPFIILSNLDDGPSRRRCCQFGCLYYLVKAQHVPKDIVELIENILKVEKNLNNMIANY